MDRSSALVLERTPVQPGADDEVEFGKYRTLVRIGRGGMAEVFVAIARGPAGFNKLSVIKRLHAGMADDEAYREMFLEEARLAARLNHPNVVQTYEVSEHDNAFFIAMEYLEGQPLNRVVSTLNKRGRPVPHSFWARLMCDVLSGLHYAHELRDFDGSPLKVVHRDVSPQNIFITYEGQVKVLDFGIAKAECSATKTQAGVLKGKAGYMAPEQLMTDGIDRRVDVFTTGTVLWELVTGKRLMSASSTAKTLCKLLNDDIPRASEHVPDIDPRLDEIIAHALQRKPEDRFATALEMREAIEKYLVSSSTSTFSPRYEELGRLVSELFADDRANLDREIREQLAAVSVQPLSGAMLASRLGEGERGSGVSAITTSMIKMTTGSGARRSSFMGVGVTNRPPPLPRGAASDPTFRERYLGRGLLVAGAMLVLGVAGVALFSAGKNSPAAAGVVESAPPVSAPTIVTTVPSEPTGLGAPALTAQEAASARPTPKPEVKAPPPPPVYRRAPAAPEPKAAAPSPGPKSATTTTPQAPPPPATTTPPASVASPPAASDPPARERPPSPAPAPTEGRRFRISL